jgi:RNA polymerase sigma factor (sigma-70 family)
MEQIPKEQWLKETVKAYESRLQAFISKLVPEAVAREIVQDTFLKLWNTDAAAVEGRVPEWLFTVARNGARDYLKKERRMDLSESPAEELVAEDPSPLPVAILETRQVLAQVLAAIQRLKPAEQEVVRLKFHEGFDYKEISRITGHSSSYIGLLIHQSIQKIRKELIADLQRSAK